MPLPMTRPWKHPKSGVYWLRRVVPADLRELVGKREEKLSLATKDPAEAKVRHSKALAEIDLRWSNLRSGPRRLTEREAHDFTRSFHDVWIEKHRDFPSTQKFWDVSVYDRMFEQKARGSESAVQHLGRVSAPQLSVEDRHLIAMEWECKLAATERLASLGFEQSEPNILAMARAIAAAIQRASIALQSIAQGVHAAHKRASGFGSAEAPFSSSPARFDKIIEGWATERRPVEKTVYEWSRVMRQLAEFLGHDDAVRVSDEDVIRWKNAMVEAGLRSKTVQDAKLAPVRTLLQWAFRNKLIASNPAADVSIDVRTKAHERKRSFTDEEAKLILRAAMKDQDPVRRWVPWIGAYTGARVSEICQLRKEDVLEIDGQWCIKFSAEAGSLKTEGSERIVPVHLALAKQGFVSFVIAGKTGPIFAGLSPDKFGKRGGNGTKIIGRFVRRLGLTDPRLSPSHSWRHRMRTLGRRYGLAGDIMNAITGHGSNAVADAYGEFPMGAIARELEKIPELALT